LHLKRNKTEIEILLIAKLGGWSTFVTYIDANLSCWTKQASMSSQIDSQEAKMAIQLLQQQQKQAKIVAYLGSNHLVLVVASTICCNDN
jgi:hypothetical protein